MGVTTNLRHEIELELESHELAVVCRQRYLDDMMIDVLDSAPPSGVDGVVILTGSRFAFEHLVGKSAHVVNVVNVSRRFRARSNAASALAHH